MPFIAPLIEGVVALAGTVGSFVAGAGILGQGLILAGVGVAASYIGSLLTPKPQTDNTDSNSPSGVNFERDYGTNVSRQVACGLVGLAGHDVYVNTFNDANRTLQQLYVVSDFPCVGLSRVWAGGVELVLGTDIGDGKGQPVVGPSNVTFANGNCVWIKFIDGTQTTADSFLTTFANPAGRWSSSDVGHGVAYISVLMEYDQDNNNSFPDFFFEVKGAPLYDFRKDSTVGGSGSHRWGDVTTYEFSENPVIMEYNYRRGFSWNGDLFCGMGMDPSDLPVDKFTVAANLCDEGQSDGLPRYICSMLLDCMTSHGDNLQALALSCGAMQIDTLEGSWPLVGSDQTVVATFTDADIISTADFKRTEKQSMSTLVNSVSGNYPDFNQLWSMVGYDPQIASSFVTIDRRTRDLNIDFPQVRLLRQADQLAWIYLYENRFEITATVTLRPRFQVLECGDWVNWDSARYGLKTFIVTGIQLLNLDNQDGPRNIIVSLQQRDGQIYDGVTPVAPVYPFPNGDPVYMSEVQDLALVAVSVVGSGGNAQAAIRVSWDAPTDITVTSVDVEYYPTADPTSIIHKTVTSDITVVVVAEGVVSDTDYTVRTRIITTPNRVTTYDAGATVHTLDTGTGVSLADFDAALTYQVTTLLNSYDTRMADLEQQIAAVASNQNARNWTDKRQSIQQLQSVTGNLTASITQTMTVATDTQTAFASFQTTVTAALGDQSASITENSTAIADINTGLVASWSLTLNVGGHITGIKQLSDGTTGSFIINADVFEIFNGTSAVPVFTEQTVGGVATFAFNGNLYADGSITAQSLSVGTLSAITANLGTITTGLIQTASGFTVIDLVNERIIFSDNS